MYTEFVKDNIYRNYVGGDWVIADDSKLIEIYSPIDDSLIGKVSAMNKAEVDKAIRIAKENVDEWKKVPVSEKADMLYKAAEILEEQKDKIVDILIREVAKDRKSAVS